jgi:hypothetical protein
MKKLEKSMGKINAVPSWNYMFLSCNKMSTTDSGIILTGSSVVNDEQVILKVGPSVKNYKVGDTVKIDVSKYVKRQWDQGSVREAVMKETPVVVWPIYDIDGVDVMMVPDNNIMWSWPKENAVQKELFN